MVKGSRKGELAEQPLLFPIVQSELHPSPSTLFPSSHYSDPTRIPSPHMERHSPPDYWKPAGQDIHELFVESITNPAAQELQYKVELIVLQVKQLGMVLLHS